LVDQNAGSSGKQSGVGRSERRDDFTLYRITLHNSPKFHVKLDAAGSSCGRDHQGADHSEQQCRTALTYSNAHNTDGIDPGEAASDGTSFAARSAQATTRSPSRVRVPLGSSTWSSPTITSALATACPLAANSRGRVGHQCLRSVHRRPEYGTSGGSSNGFAIKSDTSRGGLSEQRELQRRSACEPVKPDPS